MDILLEIALSAAWAFFFLFLISKLSFFRLEGIPIRWIQGVFVLKVLAGVTLWAIYTFYYPDRHTADIYKYFDDSKPMFDAIHSSPSDYFKMLFGYKNDGEHFNRYYNQMYNWFREYDSGIYNDSHTLIRFNAALRLISFGYFNVHTVFMCFISLLGLVAIYKTFASILKENREWLFLVVFLMPSVLFWGSGVLKEGLIFLGIGFLVYFFNKLIDRQGRWWLALFWVLSSAMLLMFTKFYVLGAIIPGLIALAWVTLFGNRKPLLKYAITYVVCIVIGLGAHTVLPAPNPLAFLSAKQKDFNLLVKGGVYVERIIDTQRDTLYIEAEYYNRITYDRIEQIAQIKDVPISYAVRDSLICEEQPMIYGDSIIYHLLKDYGRTGSSIKTTQLEPNLLSFTKALPRAFYNSFFRPWPFESLSPLTLFAGIENGLVLLFLLYALVKGNWREANKKWLLFCIGFVLVIYLLTGLTTPVLGSIVRYRVPALPFLLVVGLLLHPPLKKDILSGWFAKRKS